MKKWQASLNQILSKAQLPASDWWYLLALLVVLSLGQLQRFSVNTTVSFYLHDILIFGWLVLHFKQIRRLTEQVVSNFRWVDWWLELAFGGWLLFGMLLATPELTPWLYLLRIILYAAFLISLRVSFQKEPTALRIMLTCLGLLYVWFGIVQYALLPDTTFLFALGWDDHYYRLISTLLDPNFTGMIMVLVIAYLFSIRRLFPFPLQVAAGVIMLSALTVTYSRSSYLAFLVLLGLTIVSPPHKAHLFAKKSRLKLSSWLKRTGWGLAALSIMFFTYMIAPKPGGEGVDLSRTVSIQARAQSTQLALSDHGLESILIGKGFYSSDILHANQPHSSTHARVPDNLFVLIFASTGVMGLLLFIGLLIKYAPQLAKHDWLMFTALLATLTHAQFNNTLLEPFVFLFLGMGLASLPKSKPNITLL